MTIYAWIIVIALVVLLRIVARIIAPIKISSIEELQKIGYVSGWPLDGKYILTKDIDASITITWNHGRGFSPIGNKINRFTGTLNGRGHVIKGLYINRPDQTNIGLFRSLVSSASIKNLGLENCTIIGGSYVGGLAGYSSGSISGCYVSGKIRGSNNSFHIGGLIGYIRYGTVKDSFSVCDVSGGNFSYDIGGLIGKSSGTVKNCYAAGSVKGGSWVGGLDGNNFKALLKQSYATGSVTGKKNVGGLAGYSHGIIRECYATGTVFGEDGGRGLVGLNEDGRIRNCYWDTEQSGQLLSFGGKGFNTVQMTYPYEENIYKDWDFIHTWQHDINGVKNGGYPYLKFLPEFQLKSSAGHRTDTGKKFYSLHGPLKAKVPCIKIVKRPDTDHEQDH
ncbi:MAG: phage tail tape measure protein [Candidatus Hydrogenedentes bacterium]|nr:phage tail tape measure protein [Candidatus Hydrogenedentota bacterium]